MDILEKDEAKSWSEQEFRQDALGDQRLNKRLKKLAEDLSASPGAPINQASKDWAATKAAYRFFQNDKVTSEKILSAHRTRTWERIQHEPVVLAIQDTRTLTFRVTNRQRA